MTKPRKKQVNKNTQGKWKVAVRTTCSECDKPLTGKRHRTYCSIACRTQRNYRKNRESGRGTIFNRKKRDAAALIPSPDKIKCLVCKKWYVQVCSHVYYVHGMTGREYKEYFDLEVKRGQVPQWYREKKADITLENKTYKNLKAGKKFWFKKNSKIAGRYKRSAVTLAKLKLNCFKMKNK
jgi:hypothetical protein